MELMLLYWAATGLILVVGFVMLIANAVAGKPLKMALRTLITGVILLVIGAGACAVILSNLGGMH
ncbi:hypothetical protein [Pedobacter sp. MC2016-24]|uniref:hypothetical protein n=1 Tax=Pedobacter sp. MC2016-24 TaxID=2780090 RepID=UPI00187EDD6B|nr:hypothetical protein [Pedobacter sp. MC2016-24]MBE9602918.1 hypothetical protein [Pedobacter sp. MC2016-24]